MNNEQLDLPNPGENNVANGGGPSCSNSLSSLALCPQPGGANNKEKGSKSKEDKEPKDQKEEKKKEKKKKKKKKMFDEEVDKYDTYEEYLDSLVSEEDHFYLEDEDMARIIAELGYRSSGDTLSRENFEKMKSRLANKRLFTLRTSTPMDNGTSGEGNGIGKPAMEESRVLKELKQRAKDISSGSLHSIFFLQTKYPRRKPHSHSHPAHPNSIRARIMAEQNKGAAKHVEVSGHIDLAHRQRTENFFAYLAGERRMVPKQGDLTFYNWTLGQVDFNSTPNFEVIVEGSKRLLLRHKPSDIIINITDSGSMSSKASSMDSADGLYSSSGWTKIKCEDEFDTILHILDVRLV